MIRKICPVCEQTMGRFNYCKNCRQFVKTPYVRDVTYYLNESHSKEETSCDYHGIPRARTRAETGNGAAPLPRDQTVSPMGAAGGHSREKRGRKILYVVFGIFLLAQIVVPAWIWIMMFFIPKESHEADEYKLLSDEEVQREGTACSSNGHYGVSGAKMEEEMGRILAETGYHIGSVESSSWNYIDNEDHDPWTDYETSADYFIYLKDSEGEALESAMDSVTVRYDTATGQLHGVSFYLTQIENGAFMAGRVVEFLQKQGEIPEDEAYGELVKDYIPQCSDRGEDEEGTGYWQEIPKEGEDRTEVYFHESQGMVYIRIWKVAE